MPCYDSRNDPAYVATEAREQALRDSTHNSPVAELLCWTISHMELPTRAKFLTANPTLARWWREHQERDRKKAEKERDAAQKKAHNSGLERQIRALQRQLK